MLHVDIHYKIIKILAYFLAEGLWTFEDKLIKLDEQCVKKKIIQCELPLQLVILFIWFKIVIDVSVLCGIISPLLITVENTIFQTEMLSKWFLNSI